MPEDRKNLGVYTGAGVGGQASSIRFAKDEAGRLEVTVGAGPNPAIAILSPEDAEQAIHDLNKIFPMKDHKEADKTKDMKTSSAPAPKSMLGFGGAEGGKPGQPTEPARPIPGQPAKNPAGGVPAKS